MCGCDRIQTSDKDSGKQKVVVHGNVEEINQHQSGNVYGSGGAAPNIMAGTHGYGMGYILEIHKKTESGWKKLT